MESLFFFCYVVLASAWLDKFHDLGNLHKALGEFLDLRKNPSRKKFISIFRGSYKSTFLIGYVIWLMVKALVENEPMSICYNTATKENAENFIGDLRETILECSLLHWIFPELPKDANAYRSWSLKRIEYKHVKLHVASLDTKQVSRHYVCVVNDDLVNDDNAFSDVEREKIKRKWKFQKSIITKYSARQVGLEIDVGTPFHPKDLMSQFINNRITSYDKFVIPYALPFERGSKQVVDPFLMNGKLTLPEIFCWEDFQDLLSEQGKHIFTTQYGLKTLEEADILCKESELKYYTHLPENYIRHVVIDAAVTEGKGSSATGITIVDWDDFANMNVIYAEELWIAPMQLIEKIREIKKIYDPDEIFIEREKASITIADTLDHLAPELSLTFVDPENQPKPKRIQRLKQWFNTGRVLLKPGLTDFENQILDYPDVNNTDMLDSLAYQLKLIDLPNKKIRHEREVPVERTFEDELDIIQHLNERSGQHDAYF